VSKKSDEFSMNDAMRLAKSPAAQQLFAALQAQNADTLQQAMDQAAAGDYEQVKKTMSALLQDPKMQALLRRLGG
jgi:catalase (peroxidase I)